MANEPVTLITIVPSGKRLPKRLMMARPRCASPVNPSHRPTAPSDSSSLAPGGIRNPTRRFWRGLAAGDEDVTPELQVEQTPDAIGRILGPLCLLGEQFFERRC